MLIRTRNACTFAPSVTPSATKDGKERKERGGGWRGGFAVTWSRISQSRIPHASWRLRLKITPPEGSSLRACRARTLPRMRQKFRRSCPVPWGVAWRGLKSAGARLRRAGPPAAPAAGLVCAHIRHSRGLPVPNVGKEARATCRRSTKSRAWASTAGSHAAAAITGNPQKNALPRARLRGGRACSGLTHLHRRPRRAACPTLR